MKFEQQIVKAGGKDFKILKVSFEDNDKELIKEIKNKAKILSTKVSVPGPGGNFRGDAERYNKALGGVFAERAVSSYVTECIKSRGIKAKLRDIKWTNSLDQIDAAVEVNGKTKELEIRSSFSYKTSFQRLFEGAFSMIGWYVTRIKGQEKKKDFYIFVVFFFDPAKFDALIEANELEFFVFGGDSKEGFNQKGVDNSLGQFGAKYRILNPVTEGMDAIEVINDILESSG